MKILPIDFSNNWDIPVLKMKPETRRLLFKKAYKEAQNNGFIFPLTSGIIIAWEDILESKWLGKLAIRAWSCCGVPLTLKDLKRFSEALYRYGTDFAALSGWMPFPECEDFLNVGASVYAAFSNILNTRVYDNDEYHTEILPLGRIPEYLISQIVTHVSIAKWYDRHARDFNLDPEKVKQRRTMWIRNELKSGDGFLIIILDKKEEPGAYLFVPFDRRRQESGGPIVAGINGLAGSFHEGRWLIRRAYIETLQRMKSTFDVGIIQYQEDNKPIKFIVERSLSVNSCIRYDLHWHKENCIKNSYSDQFVH